MNNRPTVTQLMLTIATILSTRATCQKLHVGAVLTDKTGRILSAGYNGVAANMPHCIKDTVNACIGHCRATHAESNALLSCHAPRSEIYVCFVTDSPCVACCKQLVQTGCQQIIFMMPSAEAEEAKSFWESHGRQWLQYRETTV